MINIVSKRNYLSTIQAPVICKCAGPDRCVVRCQSKTEFGRQFLFYILEWHWYIMHLCLICSFIAEGKLITMWLNRVIPYIFCVLEIKEIDWDVLIFVWLVFVCIDFCTELWTSLHHVWQGNFCQHFYVANCCVVKPPEWEGCSCAADQSLWASTVCVLIFFSINY